MAIRFKSLRSSSSGNSLLLWTDTTKIIIDCGLGSMKKTRQILTEAVDDITSIDAVLISHMHSDHISYYPLRVIEDAGLPVWVYEDSAEQMKDKHFNGYGFGGLKLDSFRESKFEIGDVVIEPFRLPHHPDFATFGFVIQYKHRSQWKKIVIATDFHSGKGLTDYFKDADFIFVESNHDLELLRQYYNPNSRYHLSNPKAGGLLYDIQSASHNSRRKVMLGHLSRQRNTDDLAVDEVKSFFADKKAKMDFELLTASADSESEAVELI